MSSFRNSAVLITILSAICVFTIADEVDTSTVTCPIGESALLGLGLYAPHDLSNNIKVSECHPKHVHLSVGLTPWTSMTISFSIPQQCNLDDVTAVLRYGFKPSEMTGMELNPETYVSRFNYTSTKLSYDLYESDHLYHVPLTELEPSQSYSYQIVVIDASSPVEDENRIWESSGVRGTKKILSVSSNTNEPLVVAASPFRSFETTAKPGGNIGTKMAIVADLGQTHNATVTMLHMYRETLGSNGSKPASVVLCGGDCAYADANADRWDHWFTLIEPLISKVPMQVSVGNHECECDNETFDMFTPYEYRFKMPNKIAARRHKNTELCLLPNRKGVIKQIPSEAIFQYDYGNSYYGFTHGITHVTVLNCYAPSHKNSRQYNWLLDEFNGIDRDVTPWLLVMVHCPLYNTFKDHQEEFNAVQMLKAMEDLFMKYRVNFVVSGHAHGYMRSLGVAYQKVNKVAPIYITVGEGGCREGHAVGYKNKKPEEWLATRDNTEFGFGTMDFINTTMVHWKWIRNLNVDEQDFTDEVFIENQWLYQFKDGKGEELKDSV